MVTHIPKYWQPSKRWYPIPPPEVIPKGDVKMAFAKLWPAIKTMEQASQCGVVYLLLHAYVEIAETKEFIEFAGLNATVNLNEMLRGFPGFREIEEGEDV